MRHVHRTHRVNFDWLYEVFSSTNYRCRLRYASTKHQIADIHTKAITTADVWIHLTKLAQLMNTLSVHLSHVARAGTSSRRATSLCIRLRPFCAMSTGFAALENVIPSQDVVVFRCPACNHVEADKTKLKWKVQPGSSIALCCGMCEDWNKVLTEVQIKA